MTADFLSAVFLPGSDNLLLHLITLLSLGGSGRFLNRPKGKIFL